MTNVLITGGAGFIGSHLADELIEKGYNVKVLDNLDPQVHGEFRKRPSYLNPEVDLIVGDVRDRTVLKSALKDVDVVYHLAAKVGVGQSMYAIEEYTSVNNVGTAVLLECLIEQPVKKLIVASSMSIYGEGAYLDGDGNPTTRLRRNIEQLKRGEWELFENGQPLSPIPTDEHKTPDLSSVYALSKFDQERLCLLVGQAYNIPTVALRFFNVYGTRQALSNPYTGVLAIFASRFLNGNQPLIFEDGNQQRDFVHVKDLAQACRLAMEVHEAAYEVFNIGSGNQYTVLQVAEAMAATLGLEARPEITGKYRVGDIRHCFADIGKARNILGYQPQVSFEDGLHELADWLKDQVAVDQVDKARTELVARGLAV